MAYLRDISGAHAGDGTSSPADAGIAASSIDTPPRMATPPPLPERVIEPPPIPSPAALRRMASASRIASLKPQEIDHAPHIVEEARQGIRYRMLPYPFSYIIHSTIFAVDARPHRFAPNDWPIAALYQAAWRTLLLGWWALPLGPIFTLYCLLNLWNGGLDVTHDLLKAKVGEAEASNIMLSSKPPKAPREMWGVRSVLALPFLLVSLVVGLLIYEVVRSYHTPTPQSIDPNGNWQWAPSETGKAKRP
jgi:hypothetical protein